MRSERTPAPAGRRSRRRPVAGLALPSGVLALALIATAGPAAAAPGGTVIPRLDCITPDHDGTYTAVLGYSSTWGGPVHIPFGRKNRITPARFDGRQPTWFDAGGKHGVFTVPLDPDDLRTSASWTLSDTTLTFGTADQAKPCPPGTTMPVAGNGAGAALGLLAAGAVGALLLHRFVRRASADRSPLEGTRA